MGALLPVTEKVHAAALWVPNTSPSWDKFLTIWSSSHLKLVYRCLGIWHLVTTVHCSLRVVTGAAVVRGVAFACFLALLYVVVLFFFFLISFNITFLVWVGRGCLICKAHPVLFYKWAFWASECKKMQKKSDTEIMWNKTRVIFCIFWSAKYWEKTLFWANINILLRIYRHIIWEYEHISSEVTFEVWSLCRYRIPVAEIPVLLSSMRQASLLEILWYVIYWLK